MNRQLTEKLLLGLRSRYPAHIWAASYPSLPVDDWHRELQNFSNMHVKHALDNLRTNHSLHPPTSMQFANLCEQYRSGAGQGAQCTATDCIVKTTGGRCLLHPASMSVVEDRVVSAGIERNFEAVRFYLFIAHVRPHEIYDPKLWGWSDFALAGIADNPLQPGESAGDYERRMGANVKIICGMDPRHLTPLEAFSDKPRAQEQQGLRPLSAFQ